MASEVTICNMALARIGIDQTIEDLADTSARARACKLWYAHCRDFVLADAPWNWAMKVAPLAQVDGGSVPGWSRLFRYPVDCLALRDLTDEGGSRQRINDWLSDLYVGNQWQTPRYSFEVRQDASEAGKVILTDVERPYALYTVRVTDPAQFDVKFTDTLAWRIGMELAVTLRAEGGKQRDCAQMYVVSKAEAKTRYMNEQRPDRQPESVSIQARL